MIEVQGLTKTYGDITALNDVSFTVEKGQIVGFLGANGAGKTTTMDILCGCIGTDQGSAKIAGFDITEQPKEAKKRLGYLPDEPPLHNDMRVYDFVTYAAKLRGVAKEHLKTKVDQALEKLGLADVKTRLVGNLSKGYRQRVALAQALVHDPEVLVLDEPTEGLDPIQIVQIRELIRKLGGQHTIILSSHILSEVQNTCDHIIIIHQGKVVEQGTYDELMTKLESKGIYTLRVGRNAEKLIQELKGNPSLASAKLKSENLVEFTLKGQEDELEKVAKVVVSGGYGLREMSAHKKNLEDIYFELTH